MKKQFRVIFCAMLFAFCGNTAFARCFDILDPKPRSIGSAVLLGPADSVCVNGVNAFGPDYWDITFRDSRGVLAGFASQTELLGRCPGFCRTYEITSGTVDGRVVDLDGTIVEFRAERNSGTLTIHHRDEPEEMYQIVVAATRNQPSDESHFSAGQTVSGQVNGNSFKVTVSQSQTSAILERGGLSQVLQYNANPNIRPRCLCKVYESGGTSIAIEFRGNQAVSAYWQ